jgi:hypothetical protein
MKLETAKLLKPEGCMQPEIAKLLKSLDMYEARSEEASEKKPV